MVKEGAQAIERERKTDIIEHNKKTVTNLNVECVLALGACLESYCRGHEHVNVC